MLISRLSLNQVRINIEIKIISFFKSNTSEIVISLKPKVKFKKENNFDKLYNLAYTFFVFIYLRIQKKKKPSLGLVKIMG